MGTSTHKPLKKVTRWSLFPSHAQCFSVSFLIFYPSILCLIDNKRGSLNLKLSPGIIYKKQRIRVNILHTYRHPLKLLYLSYFEINTFLLLWSFLIAGNPELTNCAPDNIVKSELRRFKT